MRVRLSEWIISLGVGIGLAAGPVQAQVSENQVNALVEALRQAAPADSPGDDLYGEWQVTGAIIPRWSKACTGQALTPNQFRDSPVTARKILTCVMRDVLREETQISQGNVTLGVRRAAAWWLTGDASRYAVGDVALYTQRVLGFYQTSVAPATTPTAAGPAASPSAASAPASRASVSPGPATSVPDRRSPALTAPNKPLATPYDRYMSVGYAATQRKDYATARLYFQRALDERPGDTYATQALRNIESYQTQRDDRLPDLPASRVPKASVTPPVTPAATVPTIPLAAPSSESPTAASSPASDLTQAQAITLINRWLDAKAEIFAPPFDQTQASQLTTGELATALLKPAGVLDWLKQRQAYYRYGVQKVDSVERFVVSGDRATIELTLIEDRTLYRNGAVDPKQTDFSAKQIRFSLEWTDGRWKIADYKTLDGFLLERAILGANAATDQSNGLQPQTP